MTEKLLTGTLSLNTNKQIWRCSGADPIKFYIRPKKYFLNVDDKNLTKPKLIAIIILRFQPCEFSIHYSIWMASSADPDDTSLGLHCLLRPVWLNNVKVLKIRTPKKCYNHPKKWTKWFYRSEMHRKDVDGMANSPLPAVWSGSALFAQTSLSKNLGSLPYLGSLRYQLHPLSGYELSQD